MIRHLETEHLILRKGKAEDAECLLKNIWSDASLAKMMLWTPLCSTEEAKIRLAEIMEFQKTAPFFFAALKENDEVIGFAGIKETEPGIYEDCGLCIAGKYQRHGYAKEIVKELSRYIFEDLNGQSFYYSCFHENTASKALIRSLGFQYIFSRQEIRRHDGLEYTADYYLLSKKA